MATLTPASWMAPTSRPLSSREDAYTQADGNRPGEPEALLCDREGLRVMQCNLDGSQHEVVIQRGDWYNKADAEYHRN
ncbi:MAG: hypothetical protein MMC23_002814 [Stictis urceolatum]|nr:hypothetical protein [Stictis urceolata]